MSLVLLEELREIVGALFEAEGLFGELAGTLHEGIGFGAKGVDGFFGLGTLGIFWHPKDYAPRAPERSAKTRSDV